MCCPGLVVFASQVTDGECATRVPSNDQTSPTGERTLKASNSSFRENIATEQPFFSRLTSTELASADTVGIKRVACGINTDQYIYPYKSTVSKKISPKKNAFLTPHSSETKKKVHQLPKIRRNSIHNRCCTVKIPHNTIVPCHSN